MSKLQAIAKILKQRFPNLQVLETIAIAEEILEAVQQKGE